MRHNKFFLLTVLMLTGAFVFAACTPQEQQAVNDAMMDDSSDDSMMQGDDDATKDDSMMEDDSAMMDKDDDAMMDDSSDDSMMKEDGDSMMEDDKGDDSMMMEDNGDVRVIEIDGFNFGYSQDVIRVSEGEKVRIVLTSSNGFHDWVVDEFDAATERVMAGDTTSVEFTADKKGSFEFYCSVGSHRANGMKGTLIVE